MIDAHEREMLARSIERALTRPDGDHHGAALDAALDDLGWRDVLAADPRTAVTLLFEAQGAAGVTSSALDQLLADTLGHAGSAVVLPAIGEREPPATVATGRIEVRGLAMASWPGRPTAMVVARRGDRQVAYAIEPGDLPTRPVGGIDPSLGLFAVEGTVTAARELGRVDWPAAVAAGQLALGHELVGASRRMLELARQHALDRVQFGQPIARFQAVRHRLAETLVAIEAGAAALDAAWLSGSPELAELAALAKSTAGRAARVAARHCQQVLAGVGFTTEHPLHRYVRRVHVLEQLLGSTHTLTRQLGADILARRQLPPLLPL